jgi:hypothetical protein
MGMINEPPEILGLMIGKAPSAARSRRVPGVRYRRPDWWRA